MGLNKNVRGKIANFLLFRELRSHQRERKLIPFSSAKKIGILYDSTIEKNYELIKKLVKEIRGQQKDVLALGYYNKRQLPETRFVKLGLDFFTKKSLNWYLKPHHPQITNFMNVNFDILITLDIEKCFPLRYISAYTKAKFKVGRYDKKSALFCDFMISADENISLSKFIEQIFYYLNLLKNDSLQKI